MEEKINEALCGGGGGKTCIVKGKFVFQKNVQCTNCGSWVLPQSMYGHKKTSVCKNYNPNASMAYGDIKRAHTSRY